MQSFLGHARIKILTPRADTPVERRTVVAMRSDLATGNNLRFSSKIEELENVGAR